MTEFLIYDLKVAVLIAVFYMFYRLLLSRETFHRVNRVMLLLTAIASFLLPLCVITMHKTVTVAMPEVSVGELQMEMAIDTEPEKPLWQVILPIIYIIGVVATLGHTLLSIQKVMMLIRRCERYPQADGTTICVSANAKVAPFSWMRYIVMNESDYEAQDAAILAHERGHIRMRHSYDVVLVDLLTALQWFNPAMWMLRQDLRAIHEYEADGAVLSQGINARQYQYLLITKAASIGGYSIANGISHSTLKNRIKMMTNKTSRSSHLLKLLALLPIVGAALALNARTVTDYVYDEPQKQQPVKKGKTNATIKTGSGRDIQIIETKKPNDKTVLIKEDTDHSKTTYDIVEEMPEFPGGIGKLMEYVAMNVRYPKEAEEKGIQGRVIATFVVEKDGSITDAEISKNVDPALDAEALRVIKDMPNWSPGKQDGEPVRVKFTIPVTFRLQGSGDIPTDNVKGANVMNETVVVGYGPEDDPYILVDGNPIDSDKLKDIDPKTIEHMEVLKSKPAIEKFGVKGKNGVIIITTKNKK